MTKQNWEDTALKSLCFVFLPVYEVSDGNHGEHNRDMYQGICQSLERRFRELARRVWNHTEARFESGRGLIRCGSAGLLRLEPKSYKGPEVSLHDGTVVKAGTPVAEMHLDSRKVVKAYGGGQQSIKGALTLARDLGESLHWIRAWLLEDPVGQNVQFIFAVTLLDKDLKRLGFEVIPLPTWPWVSVGIYMRWLSYLYRPAGSPLPPRSSLVPKQAWMSRDRFLRTYSSENAGKLSLRTKKA